MQENNAVEITSDRTELVSSPADKETTVSNLTLFNSDGSNKKTYTLEVYRADTGKYSPFEEDDLDPKGRRIYPRSILLAPNDKLVASIDESQEDDADLVGFVSYYVLDESGSTHHFNPRGKWDSDSTYSFLDVVEFDGKAYVLADRDDQSTGEEPREGEAGYGEGVPWERLISGISWRGEWDSGTTYFRMDMVVYGNRTYLCLEDGIKDVRPSDDEDDRWRGIASTLTWRGEWDSSKTYYRLDLVTFGNERYIALEDKLVNVDPREDDRWRVVFSRINWQHEYSSDNKYRKNDVVSYKDGVYIAVADIAEDEKPDSSSNWELMFSAESGDNTELEDRVTTLEEETSKTQSNVSDLQDDMDTAKSDISTLKDDVSTLQDEVENMDMSSELESKLDSMQADLQELLAHSGLVDDEFDIVWYERDSDTEAESTQGILADTRENEIEISLVNATHGDIVAICDAYGNSEEYPIRVSSSDHKIAGEDELVIAHNYASMELIFVGDQWRIFQ